MPALGTPPNNVACEMPQMACLLHHTSCCGAASVAGTPCLRLQAHLRPLPHLRLSRRRTCCDSTAAARLLLRLRLAVDDLFAQLNAVSMRP